jgi:protein-tyrosine phosphatase
MKHAAWYFLFGAVCLLAATTARGWAWLLAWPGISFIIVAAGYARLGPRVLGKTQEGRLPLYVLVLHWPFLLFSYILWGAQRLWEAHPCAHRVAPGIWVGRRPHCHELPAEVDVIVDVTAEFPARSRVVGSRRYVCIPTLDGMPCDRRAFVEAIDRLADEPQTLFIHCAQGRGRSATLAAALLIRRGLAQDVEEAEKMLLAARPSVRISPAQRQLVAQVSRRARLKGYAA